MKRRYALGLLLAAVLILTSCVSGTGSSDFQVRASRFLDTAIPIVDELAAAETDADRLEDYATARAALEGLRLVATADASLEQLRELAPTYRAILLARGDEPDEAARKVSIFLLALAGLEAALA